MNLAQTIYTKGCEAGAAFSANPTPHDLASGQLDSFKTSGFDPADYTEWLKAFDEERIAIAQRDNLKAFQMKRLAVVKMPSELKPSAALPAGSAPPSTPA